MSRQLLQQLADLRLPPGDFAVFGSGPLLVRGIIESSNDIDVLCRGAAWEQVRRAGELQYLERYDVHVVTLAGGRLSFGQAWGIGNFDVDLLIDTAETIDGLPFVRLEHVIAYKKLAARPKDLEHLRLVQAFADH